MTCHGRSVYATDKQCNIIQEDFRMYSWFLMYCLLKVTSLYVDQLIPQTDTRKFNKKTTPRKVENVAGLEPWKKDRIKGLELVKQTVNILAHEAFAEIEIRGGKNLGGGRFEKKRGSRIKDSIVCNQRYCSSHVQRQRKFSWFVLELLLDPLSILSFVGLV